MIRAYMASHSLTIYDTLSVIYRNDIATGEGAEGIAGEAIGNSEEEFAADLNMVINMTKRKIGLLEFMGLAH
jgi:hypothetical protein